MTLNLNDVENFKIACPTNSDEADDIVTILTALDCMNDLRKQRRAVLNELFKALLHQLVNDEGTVSDIKVPAPGDGAAQRAEVPA
jgi:type I restriction enzyme S subunit